MQYLEQPEQQSEPQRPSEPQRRRLNRRALLFAGGAIAATSLSIGGYLGYNWLTRKTEQAPTPPIAASEPITHTITYPSMEDASSWLFLSPNGTMLMMSSDLLHNAVIRDLGTGKEAFRLLNSGFPLEKTDFSLAGNFLWNADNQSGLFAYPQDNILNVYEYTAGRSQLKLLRDIRYTSKPLAKYCGPYHIQLEIQNTQPLRLSLTHLATGKPIFVPLPEHFIDFVDVNQRQTHVLMVSNDRAGVQLHLRSLDRPAEGISYQIAYPTQPRWVANDTLIHLHSQTTTLLYDAMTGKIVQNFQLKNILNIEDGLFTCDSLVSPDGKTLLCWYSNGPKNLGAARFACIDIQSKMIIASHTIPDTGSRIFPLWHPDSKHVLVVTHDHITTFTLP